MSTPPMPQGAQSPLRQIDLVADRFEQQWRLSQHPRIADYLDAVPAELRPGLLLELVCIDAEHRQRNGLAVTLDDYSRELPELERLSPSERADLESHVRRRDELGRTVDHVAPPAPGSSEVPRVIGRFPIAGPLGSGGQADVFLAFHPELSVPVVVKWSRAPAPADAAAREHLAREGRILAGLGAHPNLLRVYELGFHEGRPFLVLEHVPGVSLDRYGQDERPSPRSAAELVAALAEAVHCAHEQGVVHQDISPGNVLIDGRGQPRLIDFGLAWLRSPWSGPSAPARPDAGTPEYLAPEQADPTLGPVGPRTDVFGLGAVLYYLLTGRPVYEGATLGGVLRRAAAGDYDGKALKRKGVSRRLAAICRKALARSPQDRFRTAAELARALRRAVRPPRWRRVAALPALFLLAGLVGWRLGLHSPPTPDTGTTPGDTSLAVRVWRPQTQYAGLREALPVRTGDEVQVRFRVPAGHHVGLFSVNGKGRLALLQQYPPCDTPAELVYPAADQTRTLEPPPGTELLLVCGRPDGPVSEADVRGAWGEAAGWPTLDPRRLLRLQASRVKEEGEKPRDLGATHRRPEPDAVVGRLDRLREQLAAKYPYLEGLAFRHE